jgi:maltodextrin utilization protein YvdJ
MMSARSFRSIGSFAASAALALAAVALPAQAQSIGIFAGQQDVGAVLHAGSAQFDAAHDSYTVAGSGEGDIP